MRPMAFMSAGDARGDHKILGSCLLKVRRLFLTRRRARDNLEVPAAKRVSINPRPKSVDMAARFG